LVSEKEVWSGPYAVPTELVGEGARKTGGTYWTCTDNVTIKRNQFLLECMNHLSTVSYTRFSSGPPALLEPSTNSVLLSLC